MNGGGGRGSERCVGRWKKCRERRFGWWLTWGGGQRSSCIDRASESARKPTARSHLLFHSASATLPLEEKVKEEEEEEEKRTSKHLVDLNPDSLPTNPLPQPPLQPLIPTSPSNLLRQPKPIPARKTNTPNQPERVVFKRFMGFDRGSNEALFEIGDALFISHTNRR